MKVFQLLSEQGVSLIRSYLQGAEFIDGRKAAVGKAVRKKKNTQLMVTEPAMRNIVPLLNKRFAAHNDINAYAQPKKLVSPRISSYREGDHYDWHVDMATMDGQRTDLSYTIFLNEKKDYEGGDLQMNYGNHVASAKGSVGQVLIYPTAV
ncbi:MAG: PKHD-type hydroxylase [Gammaproteobacteria bacterium]|jgi:PKHD-type hydroxylase